MKAEGGVDLRISMAKKNQSSCMNCSAIHNDRKLYNSFNGKSQNHIRSLCTPKMNCIEM